MTAWPSSKASRILAALYRVGWTLKRQSGSHKTLPRPGWPDVVFGFHDREEVGPRMLARIAKRTGLKPEDLWPLGRFGIAITCRIETGEPVMKTATGIRGLRQSKGSGAAAAALVASFHRAFGLTRYVDPGRSCLADLFPTRRPAGNLGVR